MTVITPTSVLPSTYTYHKRTTLGVPVIHCHLTQISLPQKVVRRCSHQSPGPLWPSHLPHRPTIEGPYLGPSTHKTPLTQKVLTWYPHLPSVHPILSYYKRSVLGVPSPISSSYLQRNLYHRRSLLDALTPSPPYYLLHPLTLEGPTESLGSPSVPSHLLHSPLS